MLYLGMGIAMKLIVERFMRINENNWGSNHV